MDYCHGSIQRLWQASVSRLWQNFIADAFLGHIREAREQFKSSRCRLSSQRYLAMHFPRPSSLWHPRIESISLVRGHLRCVCPDKLLTPAPVKTGLFAEFRSQTSAHLLSNQDQMKVVQLAHQFRPQVASKSQFVPASVLTTSLTTTT